MYLAVKLGLPPDLIEIVRQSALMHDIGKIGCVMNLNKPGKLTQDEYEIFKKQHPGFGRDILDPDQVPPIRSSPGVHLHHERWDRRGYPLRAERGTTMPLIARIIAVADTLRRDDSEATGRTAARLPYEVAVTEIEAAARGAPSSTRK